MLQEILDFLGRPLNFVAHFQDVIRALNRSVKLYIPAEASYGLIQPYIREASKLAWECSSLAHPLDVALATDSELYDEYK